MQRQSVTRVGVVANTPYRFIRCFLIYLQWRRQAWGTRARAPPWSLMHAVFFLLSQAFCGLKYAENAIAAGAPSRTSLGGAHDAPPDPLVGCGAETPLHTPPHSVPRCSRLRRLDRCAPLTPNPGDATVYFAKRQHNQIKSNTTLTTVTDRNLVTTG